ncbi:PstS family phosphate ABC transporter substrate-binding protein [Halovenus sp. HT40]|uniref:PstS family phosphate ABC transporter substrate-binding protein n=1 Tax=Halovenus sp. HT40 TaxID=3126691 RepID=UPI00300EBE4E
MTEDTSKAVSTASRRKFLTAAAGAGGLALAGCTESTSGDETKEITITGSSTVYPLMSAISEEFRSNNSDVDPTVNRTGSGGGFSNHFCVGNSDFNNASRPIQSEEEDLCGENGVEYMELTLATDALTVVVSEDSFADCLTVEELAQIWESDSVDTWDEVRDEFPNKEIERYGAADTSGTYDYFIENIQGSERGHTSDYTATEQDNQIAQGVKGNEKAIGYFGFSYFYQNPDGLKAVGVDNGEGCVKPSLETAKSGEYQPLTRSLYTYPSLDALSKDYIAEFARYVVEQTTDQELVAENVGYVPLSDSVQQEQMQKLEDAIEEAN